MIVVLNGPLGVGKSTLAESLAESIGRCAMLDGDHLVAGSPPPLDEVELLHSTIALLVGHYRRSDYRNFVINHIWSKPMELADLRRRLADCDADIRCFLLTLPLDENIRRIERRARGRAIDDLEVELRTVAEEREALAANPGQDLGEPFDVTAPPAKLVAMMLRRLAVHGPHEGSR